MLILTIVYFNITIIISGCSFIAIDYVDSWKAVIVKFTFLFIFIYSIILLIGELNGYTIR